jgi:hypothetical protein
MSAVVTSPEDVVNLALTRIGYTMRVVNMFEGSPQANAALNVYSQTRDEMLRAVDYGFAERNVNLELLKQAPVTGYFPPNQWNGANNPPPPWVFEYTYPADCLKVRSVKPVPLFVIDFDPQPNVFAVENDNYYTPSRKVILCNVEDAQLVYTGQVTDPTLWEDDFVEALAAALGRRLAPVLKDLNVAKFAAGDEAQAAATAEGRQG